MKPTYTPSSSIIKKLQNHNPTSNTANSHEFQIKLKNTRFPNHHRKDSQGCTYYETYPYQNQKQGTLNSFQYMGSNQQRSNDKQKFKQKKNKAKINTSNDNSICPSIQNGINQEVFEGLLTQLQNEVKLKTEALRIASNMMTKLQQNIVQLQSQNQVLQNKLKQCYLKITTLQTQIQTLKTQPRSNKSITKTFITQKSLPVQLSNQIPECQTISLISSSIFNQFIKNYQELLDQLTQWIQKQKQEQLDSSMFSKLNMHAIEIQEIIYSNGIGNGGYGQNKYGKQRDQQESKATFQTCSNQKDIRDDSGFKSISKYINTNNLLTYHEYQQVSDMYRQYCNKLSSQLQQSLTYISQLSSALQQTYQFFSKKIQPLTLLPSQLINIITKQCNKIIHDKYKEMKNQNMQLIEILNQIIGWVKRNSKDGGNQFRSVFSNFI